METAIIIFVWILGSLALGAMWSDISSGWSGLMGRRTAIEQEHTRRLDSMELQLRHEGREWQKFVHSREDKPYRS